jgi:hypothetical protein
MDPFLESQAVFPDLHDSLIFLLREALSAQLPAPYFAAIASRVWIEEAHRRIEPDVDVLRPSAPVNGDPPTPGGGVAVAQEVQTEVVEIEVDEVEVRETFIEVHAEPGGERLVTTVEVLSLANKSHSAHGRAEYVQKQREVLATKVNLVEIDLLRGGVHTTAVPLEPLRAAAGVFDFHVCVRRFDRPSRFTVYPIRLPQRLPRIAVPLLQDVPPVTVALQDLLDRCYQSAQYQRRVRYRDPVPPPALRPELVPWMEQLFREKGIVEPPPAREGTAPAQ